MINKHDIIIEDGKILLREYKYTKSISLENFAKEILSKKSTFETDQLPTNCVKYMRGKTFQRYYIHIPEDHYTLIHNEISYTVRLPHTIFVFTFELNTTKLTEDIMMSWTGDEKLDLNAETFFTPQMSNLHDAKEDNPTACNLCINTVYAETQHEYIEKFLDTFFKTSFNDDLSDGKKLIPLVSREQSDMLEKGFAPHDLIQAWWKYYDKGKLTDERPKPTDDEDDDDWEEQETYDFGDIILGKLM